MNVLTDPPCSESFNRTLQLQILQHLQRDSFNIASLINKTCQKNELTIHNSREPFCIQFFVDGFHSGFQKPQWVCVGIFFISIHFMYFSRRLNFQVFYFDTKYLLCDKLECRTFLFATNKLKIHGKTLKTLSKLEMSTISMAQAITIPNLLALFSQRHENCP